MQTVQFPQVPVYTEGTVKGDRFIKDRQHVHFVYDGVQLVSEAGKKKKRRNEKITFIFTGIITIYTVYKTKVNKPRFFYAADCSGQNKCSITVKRFHERPASA